MRLKLDFHDCWLQDIAIALSCDDISIDQFLFFFFLHSACDYSISFTVAIIALRLIILNNCLRLAKVLAMENKLIMKALVFSQNVKNNGKITVIFGSSHSDVFTKKWRNCNCTCKGNHFSKDLNYNTNFVKWISQSMALMDSVDVFLHLR